MQTVFVNSLTGGKTIVFQVDRSDTIGSLKSKIEDKVGILADEQKLVYRCNVLKSERTIADYVQHEGTIFLLLCPRGGTMRIKVITITGKEIVELDIEPTDTGARIKGRIEEKKGIPSVRQRLIYGGIHIADDETAEYYNIQNSSCIHLIPELRGGDQVASLNLAN